MQSTAPATMANNTMHTNENAQGTKLVRNQERNGGGQLEKVLHTFRWPSDDDDHCDAFGLHAPFSKRPIYLSCSPAKSFPDSSIFFALSGLPKIFAQATTTGNCSHKHLMKLFIVFRSFLDPNWRVVQLT